MGKENGKNGKAKEDLNIPVMIFCIVGSVLVVLGFLLMKNNNFKLQVFSTDGTVSGVQTATNADGVIESKTLTVSYSAVKGDYTATIYVTGDDKRQIGDKVELYYDFFAPENVNDKRRGYEGYIAIIIGAILVLKTGPKFVRILKDNYL